MTRRDQGETSTSEQNRSRGNNNIQNVLHVAKSNCIHFHKLSFFSYFNCSIFSSCFTFFLLLLQHSQTSKSQSTRLNSRSSYSSFHKRLAPSKQFQQFFIEFIRIVIYLFTSVCLQSLQISSLPECTKRFHFFT